MLPKLTNLKNRFLFSVFALLIIVSILVGSCQKRENDSNAEIIAPVALNLSDVTQQSDFKQFLLGTTDILNDNGQNKFYSGYNTAALNENEKKAIVNRMIKNESYMEKFSNFHSVIVHLEKKYQVSKFTRTQWAEVAKFATAQEIHFLPGLKEKVKRMEEMSRAAALQTGRGAGTNEVPCCVCSDAVEEAEEELVLAIASLSVTCLYMSEFPPAALACWVMVGAVYLSQNSYINSVEFWCDCMIEHYGVCVY
jgi:hypothetical protein